MKRAILLLLCFLTGSLFSFSQSGHGFQGTKTTWKGFTRYDFEFEGRKCRVVCPDKPAEGNPWIWNARFPDWHTDIDSILLTEGFFVTYINTDELIGSPKAVEVWNRYYNYLVSTHKLSTRVALEGISRGGLYVYNFAKKYPWRISCIYAEAPVCDFKTWPGGFTGGQRSDEDWKLILEMYGFKDDAEALAYRDNPIDNLDALAKARVPVLHMIGLNDRIVPPELNTIELVTRYIKLGGIATVVPCTRHPHKLEGHHFPIETPRQVADFVMYNTAAFKTRLDPAAFHQYRAGIAGSLNKFRAGTNGRVAFLGGSITWGDGWRNLVCDYLQQEFAGTRFDFINAGIPSMGSTPGAFRLEKDVLSKGPVDLLFVEAAVNDRTNYFSDRDQVRAMEGIVRHARQTNPDIDIVFMYFADPAKSEDYRSGITPQEILNHERVARAYDIPSINLALEVTSRIDAGEFTWEEDFRDLHPSPFGQNIYFQSMKALIDKSNNRGSDAIAVKATPAPVDEYNYDQGYLVEVTKAGTNGAWGIDPAWKPADGKGTRFDYVDVPMLIGDGPGKTLSFRFSGRAVGIAIASGPDAGMIEYRIDGSAWKEKDLFTPWSSSLHLPWFFTLQDDLKRANHKLEIRLTNGKNAASTGTACRIRYFYINR
jgi:pimeloyl-ACP methyl ester carboxylesterase/lysophospholipase L1-like esterase